MAKQYIKIDDNTATVTNDTSAVVSIKELRQRKKRLVAIRLQFRDRIDKITEEIDEINSDIEALVLAGLK